MTRLALLAAALAASILALAPAQAQSPAGRYRVEGTNFDGSAYAGSATITPSSGATCRIEWQTGGTASNGFCMIAGHSLAAAYRLDGAVGLVLYELQPDGSLKGVWTLADKAGSGTEVLTPAR